MAFENPFLTPSATRQSALKFLWSDEPKSSNIVNNVFEIPSYTSTAIPTNITGIKDGGGSLEIAEEVDNQRLQDVLREIANYESSNGTEDISPDPVEALKFFEDNKGLIKAGLNALDIPLAGSLMNAYQQDIANDVLNRVETWVGPEGGTPVEPGSVIGAGIKGLLPFNIGSLIKSDSVEAAKSLANAFETVGALDGYFRAAFDPTIGQITEGMFTDTKNITPAQFGTVAQAVNDRIYDNVTQGMNLNQAQNEAVEFFNPPTAISIPVEPPGSVEITNLPPLSSPPQPIFEPVESAFEPSPPEPAFEPSPPEPAFESSESLIKSIFDPYFIDSKLTEPAFEPLPPQPIFEPVKPFFEPVEPVFEPLPPQPIFESVEPVFEPLPPQPIFESVEPVFEPLPPQPIFEPVEPAFEPLATPTTPEVISTPVEPFSSIEPTFLPPLSEQPDPINAGMWSYADAEPPPPQPIFEPVEPVFEPLATLTTPTFELQEPFFEFDSLTNKWREPISFSSWQVGGYYDPFSDLGFGFDIGAK